jgi:hypothetical protein
LFLWLAAAKQSKNGFLTKEEVFIILNFSANGHEDVHYAQDVIGDMLDRKFIVNFAPTGMISTKKMIP